MTERDGEWRWWWCFGSKQWNEQGPGSWKLILDTIGIVMISRRGRDTLSPTRWTTYRSMPKIQKVDETLSVDTSDSIPCLCLICERVVMYASLVEVLFFGFWCCVYFRCFPSTATCKLTVGSLYAPRNRRTSEWEKRREKYLANYFDACSNMLANVGHIKITKSRERKKLLSTSSDVIVAKMK